MSECNEFLSGWCTDAVGEVCLDGSARGVNVPHASWTMACSGKDAFCRIDGLDGGAVKYA
jgi:hypothetical protein